MSLSIQRACTVVDTDGPMKERRRNLSAKKQPRDHEEDLFDGFYGRVPHQNQLRAFTQHLLGASTLLAEDVFE